MHFTMFYRFNFLIRQEGFAGAAKKAAELGFSGVELQGSADAGMGLIRTVEEAAELNKALDEYGLTMDCYSVGANLYNNPDAEDALKKHAELAAALGSPFLHHTLLNWLTLTEDMPSLTEGLEAAVEVSARVARYAAPLGITCLYEDQGLYANGVAQFGLFWNELKTRVSNIGICGDIGNTQFVDEDPVDFYTAYAGEFRHVHLKDYLRKSVPEAPGKGWLRTRCGDWVRDTVIGDGIIDFPACMRILQAAGYRGAYALENSHPEPYEDGTAQGMAYLTKLAKEVV